MTSSPTNPILCPVLIGRLPQLEALGHAVEAARGGKGGTVLLSGEAGIGKSRLVQEAVDRAVKAGFQVLRGSCFEPDRTLPFAPLIDLLRSFGQGHPDTDLSAALGPGALELIKLVPEFKPRLPKVKTTPALEPEAEKRRLFDALMGFLTYVTRGGRLPLMVVIEDLHWSDSVSLDFLLYLSRRVDSLPILLLVTYRRDETQPALEHFLSELDRGRSALELTLERLKLDEVTGMLHAIFGPDHAVSDGFRQRLYALTEGNPFFIEEILKVLAASGDISVEKDGWDQQPISARHIPRSIKDSVQRRSKQLSGEARHLLELAAVAGRRFDFGLLEALTGSDEAALLPVLKELVEAQLVVEDAQDRFSFRHALTREAVRLGLLRRERQRYHGRIAEALESLPADSREAQLDDLAYHFHEAGGWKKALTYSQRAGERAQAFYASQAALDHFTRALNAAGHLKVSSPTLYRERGQTYEIIGEFDKAQSDYEQALTAADKIGDDKFKWQAFIDLGFLWAERDYPRTGGYFQQALDLARQMDDPASLGHSLNRTGNWHANVGDLDEALQLHKQALVLFQELDDRRGLAETYDLLGMTSQINGDLVQGAAHYQRAVELFRELDDRQGLVSSLATLALCGPSYIHDTSFSPFTLKEAVEKGEQALSIAQEIGWRSGEIYALHCLSTCLGPQGEVQRAMELTQRGLEISEEIGHDQWLIGAHFDLGALYLEIYGLSQARQHLELALSMAQEIGSSLWVGSVSGVLASACILQGDLTRAEQVLEAALSADAPARDQMQRLCWCARAELALARSEPEAALASLDRMLADEPNTESITSIPRLSKLRSEALIALHRTAEAESELRLAQATAIKQDALSWSWRIHLASGKLLQSQKRPPEAEAEFSAAQKIIERLLASFRDSTLSGIFQAHSAALLPVPAATLTRRVEREKFGGLTSREREVAAWIAQGLSNREIANTLFVSERTVESHVTNILAKLDFPSRARIAAWATEKGLSKPAE